MNRKIFAQALLLMLLVVVVSAAADLSATPIPNATQSIENKYKFQAEGDSIAILLVEVVVVLLAVIIGFLLHKKRADLFGEPAKKTKR